MDPFVLTWNSCLFFLFSIYIMLYYHILTVKNNPVFVSIMHRWSVFRNMSRCAIVYCWCRYMNTPRKVQFPTVQKIMRKRNICSPVQFPHPYCNYIDSLSSHFNYHTERFLFLLDIRLILLKFCHVNMKIRLAFKRHNISETTVFLGFFYKSGG